MNVAKELKGTILVVKISGELDHHTAPILKEEVVPELEKGAVRHLVMDLTDLSFMDSSGLGVLLGRYKELAKWQGRMLVFGLQPAVEKLFRLSGLNRMIPVYDNREACLGALEG